MSYIAAEGFELVNDMELRNYRKPLGVIAAICPFNFSAMVPPQLVPMANIPGNTLILKTSEQDPGAAMIVAETPKEAGFPESVIDIIYDIC